MEGNYPQYIIDLAKSIRLSDGTALYLGEKNAGQANRRG